jgi:ATP-dependent Clp protease ATP-binding subunit ClpB
MQADKMTVKMREAFAEAAELARNSGHAELGVWHIFQTLLEAPGGLLPAVLRRVGAPLPSLVGSVKDRLSRLPAREQRREDVSLAEDLRKLLREAEQVRSKSGDGYLGIEHLLLAAIRDTSSESVGKLLKDAGVTQAKVAEAMAPLKGDGPSTSENPEDQYQALERFTKDLTKLAADGKVDPVIGRDKEIRRVMQVFMNIVFTTHDMKFMQIGK